MVEIVGVLALLGILALIGIPAMLKMTGQERDSGAANSLVAAQVQGRVIAGENGYTFPADFVDQMRADDSRFTNANATGALVSVARSSTTAALYAVLSASGACLVMLDRLDTETTFYATDETPANCSAAALVGAEGMVNGTARRPSTINI